MRLRKAWIAAAAGLSCVVASALAAPSVEIVSLAGPHGTAPKKWLQRLDEAGAGPTRIVASGATQPRLDDLGRSSRGRPLVKVYAVLTRRGELLLPGEAGPERYTLGDRQRLSEFFARLNAEGAAGVTTQRGKFGLTEAEFTDLFTRLSAPMPATLEGAPLSRVIAEASDATRLTVEIDAAASGAVGVEAEGAREVAGVSVGTALASLLRQQGLALAVEKPIGAAIRLRVAPAHSADETWPVGYKPDTRPSQTAPALMEFLTVEIDGYTLVEAVDAIAPRLTWRDRPLPIVWDRFVLRRDAIDPATVAVSFPRKRTYYKNLLDKLAFQARLKAELRVDEAGAPFVWMTR